MPGQLIELSVWLVICAGFITLMVATGDNSFGYFSQREGHGLFWPLTVDSFINAAMFYVNAFILMPRFLEKRAFAAYILWAFTLCVGSAIAKSTGQSIIIRFREPSLSSVSFISLTMMNFAITPFVVAFSTLYRFIRDWAGHIQERVRFNERIFRLSGDLEALHRELHQLSADRTILLDSGNEQFQIPLADINYVKAASNYVEIFTRKRAYLVYGQLKNIEPLLPKPRFLRVHRSHIVALDRIRVVNGATLTLDDTKLPVGPAYAQEFRSAWKAWSRSPHPAPPHR